MAGMVKMLSLAIAETFIEDTRPLAVKAYAYEMQAAAALRAFRDTLADGESGTGSRATVREVRDIINVELILAGEPVP